MPALPEKINLVLVYAFSCEYACVAFTRLTSGEKMRYQCCPFWLCAGFILSWSASATAALIVVNDTSITANALAPQDGFNITRDTDTNLEWLDVTLSTSRSWNAVVGGFGPGGDFEGFRHATDAELSTFLQNAGYAPGLGVDSALLSDYNAMATFFDMVGVTFFFTNSESVLAWHEFNTGKPSGPYLSIDTDDFLVDGGDSQWIASSTDSISGITGHWLVRDAAPAAVPEPTSLAIFGLGAFVLGIGGLRRGKSKQTP